MTSGEIATRATIWIAMGGYALNCSLLMAAMERTALAAYLAGLVAFIAHVLLAFGVFYGWSHSIAYEETARQTEAVTGTASGAGLYLNYLFGLIWLLDAIVWVRRGTAIHRRNFLLALLLHGFFLFMIVNGGIVFAGGPVRWFTGALLAGLVSHALWRIAAKGSGGGCGRSARSPVDTRDRDADG